MKKFEFRLASVLRLYEIRLEIEKAKLSSMLAEESRIVETIAARTEEVQRQNAAIRELIEWRSGDLRALSTYNLSAQAQNVVLHENLARVRKLIRAQRQSVLREERKVKLVSKLKERKYSEWEYSVTQQLEREAQDLWLAMHGNASGRPQQLEPTEGSIATLNSPPLTHTQSFLSQTTGGNEK